MSSPVNTDVIMPQLGESVVEGTVSRWLKQAGDTVIEFEPLLEISTDKVETEVPAPASGTLLEIFVPEGQTVERGTVLAKIGQPNGNQDYQSADQPIADHTDQSAADSEPAEPNRGRISPVVARMAAENRIDLARVTGSGLGGRITRKDIESYLDTQVHRAPKSPIVPSPIPKQGAESAPLEPWEQPVDGDLFKPTDEIFAKARQSVDTPKTAPEPSRQAAPSKSTIPAKPAPMSPGDELVSLSPMRRAIADHMVRSKLHTSPHVTTVFEVDMSAVLSHQRASQAIFEQQGLRLTLTAYFVLAAVHGLIAQPWVNSQWADQGVVLHKTFHIGMAVAIPDGLIVTVIRNAQDLNLTGAARQVGDLATRARSKQLSPDEVTGGTFTITNHGVSGSLFATPIINQPQAAILGIGALQKRVIVLSDEQGDSLAIRPMLYATLTFDHRLIDGATGDAFMVAFKKTLENWT